MNFLKIFLIGQKNVIKDRIANGRTRKLSFGRISYKPYRGFITSRK